MIGNVLEWYDFALFGFLTPIISPLFFPSEDRLASLLATYGVFALGFLMRPVGGVLFGHIGDRLGPQGPGMVGPPDGPADHHVALLPTYAQVGVLAPLLLTLIRMVQGLSVGGEFIGSISFLGEHASPQHRGFLGSWSSTSACLGNMLGSATAAFAGMVFSPESLAAWGWRVPFLCGILVGAVGVWIRMGVAESPQFKHAAAAGEVVRMPLMIALRRDRRAMLITAGLTLMLSVGYYLPWVWLPTWMSHILPHPLPLERA